MEKGYKMTPEEIAARTETRRKNTRGKWNKKLKARKVEPELLPLRFMPPPADNDVEEFGRFLGAAWRAFKGK